MSFLRGVFVVGLLAGFSSLAGPAVSADKTEAGLIRQYDFDQGKPCYEPLIPIGTPAECVAGISGDGIRFHGEGHLEEPEGHLFDSGSLSISLWFQMDRTNKDEMTLVMRDEGERLQRVFQLQIHNPDDSYGDAGIRFLGETYEGGGWEIAAFTESASILPGSWYHTVVTIEGRNSNQGFVQIWVNGRQERIVANTNPYATKRSLAKALEKSKAATRSAYELSFSGSLLSKPGVPLTIGTPGNNRYVFDGVIDDVRIYDFALNREQVRDLYRANR